MALLVARVVSPASKLATHRMLRDQTATHSLSRLLSLGEVDLEQVYAALDWLGEAQEGIEKRLAKQHLAGRTLVLYDLTSTWVTGRCCELAARGYSRDGKRDDPQIVFGLICTSQGCPVAVEVFAGNTADPATVAPQVAKLKDRYGIDQLAWVGDRGMLTQARIDTLLRPAGLDWVSSLRAPQMAALAREQGPFQPSLFDERNLLEVSSDAFPDERLIVCRNPLLAEERTRKREALLQATEQELSRIVEATARVPRVKQDESRVASRRNVTRRIVVVFAFFLLFFCGLPGAKRPAPGDFQLFRSSHFGRRISGLRRPPRTISVTRSLRQALTRRCSVRSCALPSYTSGTIAASRAINALAGTEGSAISHPSMTGHASANGSVRVLHQCLALGCLRCVGRASPSFQADDRL